MSGVPLLDWSGLGQLGSGLRRRYDTKQATDPFLDYLYGNQGQAGPQAPAVPGEQMDYASQRVSDAHAVASSGDLRQGIIEAAQAAGVDPLDLATVISYETGGTFNPAQKGPTTQWGQHRGLIQFGEPQARQYGVDWNNPVGSQLGAEGAIVKYLRDTGVKPGMGLMDVYSAVNAGGVGRYNRSDANNGGAPGTVADKVNNQMAGHRAKAARLLGVSEAPQPAYAPGDPATQTSQGAEFLGRMMDKQPMGGPMQPAQAVQQAPAQQQTAMAQPAPQAMQGGLLPDRETMRKLFQNPQTQPLAIALAQSAQQMRASANDPMAQLKYQQTLAEIQKSLRPDTPAGYRMGASGNLEAIPGGPADPDNPLNVRKTTPSNGITVSPDGTVSIGGNQKMTEAQSKDVVFYTRGNDADASLAEFDTFLTDWAQQNADKLPLGLGNYLRDPNFQQAKQAADSFLAAILRKDTGAAVTPQEFALYGPMFLPIPGDDDATVSAKRRARQVALLAIRSGLGTAEAIGEANKGRIGAPDREIAPRNQPTAKEGRVGGKNKTSSGVEWSID